MRTVSTLAFALLSLAIAPLASRAQDKPVSFHNDIKPLFTAACNGCHRPEKSKGELDMTSYQALMKGGKKGSPVVAGDAASSVLFKMIHGPEPEMPEDGDPLKPEQVAMVERWIREGAKDDTPDPSLAKVEPPVYTAAPVISSLAFSPDGKLLAVNGYHEIVLHNADGSAIEGRLIGDAPRVESITFSKDGKYLAACGGSPAEFGSVQVWDPATKELLKGYRISSDSLYGISFAPDGQSVAFGAADKVVRRVNVTDGKLLLEFKAHADWVLGTLFTLDGKQLVSAGRDKAMKLIDVEQARFIDDINNPLEACISLARHPKEERVLYGGDLGTARIYRISDNQNRTAGRNDTNKLKEFERQPGPVTAVAFSPDGAAAALGSVGEVRVYETSDGSKRLATLSGHAGPIFAIAYSPDGAVIATGGFDGIIRLFDAKTGNLAKQFPSVPIKPHTATILHQTPNQTAPDTPPRPRPTPPAGPPSAAPSAVSERSHPLKKELPKVPLRRHAASAASPRPPRNPRSHGRGGTSGLTAGATLAARLIWIRWEPGFQSVARSGRRCNTDRNGAQGAGFPPHPGRNAVVSWEASAGKQEQRLPQPLHRWHRNGLDRDAVVPQP